MGPDMPPSKKAQSPSSAATGASRGSLSPPYRGGGEGAAGAEDRADLSLSLSASFSAAKAEDEELTSLSWLHESTDLLNSFSHSGLRSVSPLQGDGGGGGGAGGGVPPPGAAPRSPSSSSPSPDPCGGGGDGSPYDLATGANRKPPYSFSCLIFMAIEDAPSKRLPVKDIYGWILEHFPYFAGAPTGWKNSVRHNLSLNKCFKKVDKDRSQSIGKGSLWSIDPEYRHNLIQALKKTPYHPYSPGLVTPSASPPNSPQTYHSPPLWPGNPFFRKNGGVLLQVPGGVIQNGAHVRSQGLFPVIRPLPVTPVGSRTSAIRSALGDYLSRGHPAPPTGDSAPSGDDQGEEDHTYSTGKSPSMPCSSQGLSDDDGSDDDDDDIIAVEVRGIKSEPREIPVDSAFLSQQPRRALRGGAAATLPWTKNRLRALGDTLPLKKRRAAAEKEESDDEEMKEAAGSLLHLAGVRACLNNITNRTAKGQKEPKEALRD